MGRGCGYRLGREADAISLLELIEAVEGGERRRTCVLRGAPCDPDGRCRVHDTFTRAHDALRQVLRDTSLADLAERKAASEQRLVPA